MKQSAEDAPKDNLDQKFHMKTIPRLRVEKKQSEVLDEEQKALRDITHQDLAEQEKNLRSFTNALEQAEEKRLSGERSPIDDDPELMMYKNLPKQYKEIAKYTDYKPNINIGQKWGDIIQKGVESKLERQKRLRRAGPIAEGISRGKLGVDRFFLGFGIFGIFLVPLAIYLHQKTRKALRQRRLNPKEIDDLEYYEEDLDDISGHICYYDLREMKREKKKAWDSIQEKLKLENEVYNNK